MDLKSCPFCGSENVEIVYCDRDCCGAKPRWVQCPCGCELGKEWDSDSQAIEAWNTREQKDSLEGFWSFGPK